uniref:Chromosome 10 open reading frame 105 n=1 Tax=Leptobrachium leishanense TaxID=445787 RepID=A0A8C5PKV8_9ANUR
MSLVFGLFNATFENVVVNSTDVPSVTTNPLPIIISLVCIFLLLATCLIFVTLCKPSALDQSLYGPHECMPYHAEDASEPQLRLWKRLGSLRRSVSSFRRSRPISQHQRTFPRRPPSTQDWSFMESTKM